MKYSGKYSIKQYLLEGAADSTSTDYVTALKWVHSKDAGAQIWEWVIAEQADKNGEHVVTAQPTSISFSHPRKDENIAGPAAVVALGPDGFKSLVKTMRDLLQDIKKGKVSYPSHDTAHSDIIVKSDDEIIEYHAKWNMSDSGRFIGLSDETAKDTDARARKDAGKDMLKGYKDDYSTTKQSVTKYEPLASARSSGQYLDTDLQAKFYKAMSDMQQVEVIRAKAADDLAAASTTAAADKEIILNTAATDNAAVLKSRRAQQRAVRDATAGWLSDNLPIVEEYFNARFGQEGSKRQNVLLNGKPEKPSKIETPPVVRATLKKHKIAKGSGTKLFSGENAAKFSAITSSHKEISVCIGDKECFRLEVRSKETPSTPDILENQKDMKPINFKGGRAMQLKSVSTDSPFIDRDTAPSTFRDEEQGREIGDSKQYSNLPKLFEWAVK